MLASNIHWTIFCSLFLVFCYQKHEMKWYHRHLNGFLNFCQLIRVIQSLVEIPIRKISCHILSVERFLSILFALGVFIFCDCCCCWIDVVACGLRRITIQFCDCNRIASLATKIRTQKTIYIHIATFMNCTDEIFSSFLLTDRIVKYYPSFTRNFQFKIVIKFFSFANLKPSVSLHLYKILSGFFFDYFYFNFVCYGKRITAIQKTLMNKIE